MDTKGKIEKAVQELEAEIVGLNNIPHIVQGRPLFDFEGVPEEMLREFGQDKNDLFEVEGRFNVALFPNGDVEGLKTVSTQYKVVQHDEAVLSVLIELPKKFDLEKVEVTVSPNGGKCFTKFTSKQSIEVKKGDKINYQILLENSADTSKRFSVAGGAWRLVCANGLIIPDSRVEQIRSRKLHKNTLDLKGEISSFLSTMEDSIASMGIWKEYAKKKLEVPALEKVFEALEVGPRVQEEILNLELRGDNTSVKHELEKGELNAWLLYNAFTQRITDSEALESVKNQTGEKIVKYFDDLV